MRPYLPLKIATTDVFGDGLPSGTTKRLICQQYGSPVQDDTFPCLCLKLFPQATHCFITPLHPPAEHSRDPCRGPVAARGGFGPWVSPRTRLLGVPADAQGHVGTGSPAAACADCSAGQRQPDAGARMSLSCHQGDTATESLLPGSRMRHWRGRCRMWTGRELLQLLHSNTCHNMTLPSLHCRAWYILPYFTWHFFPASIIQQTARTHGLNRSPSG